MTMLKLKPLSESTIGVSKQTKTVIKEKQVEVKAKQILIKSFFHLKIKVWPEKFFEERQKMI